MALGVIGSIVESIMYGPEGSDYKAASMLGINPKTGKPLGDLGEHTFQYWPETVTDTIDVGWNWKDIPGASSALAQWSGNSGRTIAFEVHLHRLMKPVKTRNFFETVLDPFKLNRPENDIIKTNRPHNVDVVQEIKWLRAFCYPCYADVDSYRTAYPPPVAILSMPKMGLGDATGGNAIYCIMTGCDVNYQLCFPDGTPRKASVSLTFRQIHQDPIDKVVYAVGHALDDNTKVRYAFQNPNSDNVNKGGKRPLNKIKGGGAL